MKLNIINSILVLVFSIVACSASSSKTIPTSSKTIPTSNSSKTISTSTKTVDILDLVAETTRICYSVKALRKRDVTVTKTVQSSKVIPNTSSSYSSKTTQRTKGTTTTTTTTFRTIPSVHFTFTVPSTIDKYVLLYGDGKLSDGGDCYIYGIPYPVTTKIYLSQPTIAYTSYSTRVIFTGIINGVTTRDYKTAITSYGYGTGYTSYPVTVTKTSRNQSFDDIYKINCNTVEVTDTKIPYIYSTIQYNPPKNSIITSINGRRMTLINVKSDYITSYSTGTHTLTQCQITTLSSTKQIPVTTTSTKQPPVITTTTTEQSSLITTTSTKQPPVITTTTSTKQPPVITTTTSTKQPPVITTTTTTTTTEQVNSTKCIPAVITVTEKEKVTVTEKETITVTVTENGSTQTNDDVRCAKKWAQCGGIGFNGPTCCESGSTCKELNQYYSQCI